MRLKLGFVTNSSSTSFIFIFNGGKIDLYRTLVKYESHFNLHNKYLANEDKPADMNVWDVIRELDRVLKDSIQELWIKPGVKNIGEVIKDTLEKVAFWEGRKKDHDLDNWENEFIFLYKHHLEVLRRCKERGLISTLVIGFGDNNGEISGGLVGTTMDYFGRSIDLDRDDFVILTEQNR